MIRVNIIFALLSTMVFYDQVVGREQPNDKIDVVLSAIMETNRKVDILTGKVADIAKLEELTSEHVAKLEFEMEDVLKSEEKLKNQINKVENRAFQKIPTFSNKLGGWDSESIHGKMGK